MAGDDSWRNSAGVSQKQGKKKTGKGEISGERAMTFGWGLRDR
jgi:hypothetical protein